MLRTEELDNEYAYPIKKHIKIINILVLVLSLGILIIFGLIDSDGPIFKDRSTLVFTILPTLAILIASLIPKNDYKQLYFSYMSSSILSLILGYVISTTNTKSMLGTFGMLYIIHFFCIYMFVILILFLCAHHVYFKNSLRPLVKFCHEEYINKPRSGIRTFNELIEHLDKEKADVLTIVGNLLSMKTPNGIRMLKKFLDFKTDNKIYLIIPKSSSHLFTTVIKPKLTRDYLDRITVYEYNPLCFLPGVAIIGKKGDIEENRITPTGLFYYKMKYSDEDEMPESGIYSEITAGHDMFINVRSYHEIITDWKFVVDEISGTFRIEKTNDGAFLGKKEISRT